MKHYRFTSLKGQYRPIPFFTDIIPDTGPHNLETEIYQVRNPLPTSKLFSQTKFPVGDFHGYDGNAVRGHLPPTCHRKRRVHVSRRDTYTTYEAQRSQVADPGSKGFLRYGAVLHA